MRLLFILIASMLVFGCISSTQQEKTTGNDTLLNNTMPAVTDEPAQVNETEVKDEVPGIMDVPDQDQVIEQKSGTPARSQSDCSTLSPNCETCVAQENCGWCKSRNGCFYGDDSGPAPGIADCPDAEWAYSEADCTGSKGGISCEDNWNCADCLSGSGCKWCIDGSKCVSSDSTETCSTGGWLTNSFQCNYASR